MSAQIFTKAYNKWEFQNKRDLIFKLSVDNVNMVPKIAQTIIYQKCLKATDIYTLFSLNILLFDRYPKILKINNTIDNKKKNTILGTTLKLSLLNFYYFFLRLKHEEGITSLTNQLKLNKKTAKAVTFCFNLNLFDEFLFLYDKYPTLTEASVTLNFVNCKKMEEKQLLIKTLLLI